MITYYLMSMVPFLDYWLYFFYLLCYCMVAFLVHLMLLVTFLLLFMLLIAFLYQKPKTRVNH